MLGQKNGANLGFSSYQIMARNNGNPASLYIQAAGGNSSIGLGGGDVYMGLPTGRVLIGGTIGLADLNVEASNFQIYLRNDETEVNDWFIGTSDASWISGDNQLIFSPTSSSGDGILRLMETSDNDGVNAPVMIASGNQTLLLDGNEIESQAGTLHINHNSDHNTYINPTGGKVGIGLTSPVGLLHINTDALGLGLQQADHAWYITPAANGDILFMKNGQILALVEAWSGNWVALSDQRLKENITQVASVMDRIGAMSFYTYGYVHGSSDKRNIGVMAQDLEQVFPEVVSKDESQYSVAYHQLGVIAIKGIQEQQAQLIEIEKQLSVVESRN
jgi:hypothetical protein